MMADRQWIISTVAGTGEQGYAGDGGPATQALLNNPFDLAFDPGGNLCFSDTYNHCIRRIDARTGVITTIAGTGESGFAGDGGPATQAQMNQPYGIVIDRAGNIYVADRLNRRVRRIDGSSGIITTLAGDGSASTAATADHRIAPDWRSRTAWHWIATIAGCSSPMSPITGCGRSISPPASSPHSPAPATGVTPAMAGPPTSADIFGARAVALAPDDSLYIMERQGSSLRRVHNGIIETVAGTGARGYAGDGPRCAPRGVRRAEGDGGRSCRQHVHRRYREPRDPPDRRAELDRHHDRRQLANPVPTHWPGRTAPSSERMARSISAIPRTTAYANWCGTALIAACRATSNASARSLLHACLVL